MLPRKQNYSPPEYCCLGLGLLLLILFFFFSFLPQRNSSSHAAELVDSARERGGAVVGAVVFNFWSLFSKNIRPAAAKARKAWSNERRSAKRVLSDAPC